MTEHNFGDLELKFFGDPSLSTPPDTFDFENAAPGFAQALQEALTNKMIELGGAGLSANQVGLNYRVFVFGSKENTLAMFNPYMVGVSKEMATMKEGCLSFPGFTLTLARPAEIAIAYQDAEGIQHTGTLSGIGARVVLHEMDHMEGMNFLQHASYYKQKHEIKKWQNARKRMQEKQFEKMNREIYRQRSEKSTEPPQGESSD